MKNARKGHSPVVPLFKSNMNYNKLISRLKRLNFSRLNARLDKITNFGIDKINNRLNNIKNIDKSLKAKQSLNNKLVDTNNIKKEINEQFYKSLKEALADKNNNNNTNINNNQSTININPSVNSNEVSKLLVSRGMLDLPKKDKKDEHKPNYTVLTKREEKKDSENNTNSDKTDLQKKADKYYR